jgi:SAM-dependent methyltransferase
MPSDSQHKPAAGGFNDAQSHWDQRFARPGLLFGEQANRFLQREAQRLAAGSQVLSVADGEGRNALYLAALGHRVSAFDISPVAVAKARELAAQRNLEVDWHIASVDDWSWGEARWDAVVAVFVQFADPAMRGRMFDGMWASLKPGGLLLVQGYTPRQLEFRTGGPGKVEHLYTSALLRELLPRADWLLLREHEDELAEGSAHVGRSALLDAVARKPA